MLGQAKPLPSLNEKREKLFRRHSVQNLRIKGLFVGILADNQVILGTFQILWPNKIERMHRIRSVSLGPG